MNLTIEVKSRDYPKNKPPQQRPGPGKRERPGLVKRERPGVGGGVGAARPRGGPPERVRGMRWGLLYNDSNKEDMLFRIKFCHCVKSFFPNHHPIPFTLGIRQAQRNTTSSQVDLGT